MTEYITKDDLEEYLDLIPSANGVDDYDARTIKAKDVFEYLKGVKFKQDLEVDRSQFNTIKTRQEAERMQRVIELLEELEELWSYYFTPKDLVVDFNNSSHVYELQEVIGKEIEDWGKRELAGYNKGLKIKTHTKIGGKVVPVFGVAEDMY